MVNILALALSDQFWYLSALIGMNLKLAGRRHELLDDKLCTRNAFICPLHTSGLYKTIMAAPPLDPPKSLLARHRVLAPTAAVHVSPICLGAMNFGNAQKSTLGECSKETAFEMLDFFYKQGGNFIDTSVPSFLEMKRFVRQYVTAQMSTRPKSQSRGWASG